MDSRLFQKIQFYLKWVSQAFRNFYSSQCDAYRFSAHRWFCQCITLAWHHTAAVIYLHSLVRAPLMQITLRLLRPAWAVLCWTFIWTVTVPRHILAWYCWWAAVALLVFTYWYVIVFSLRRTFWQFHKYFTSHSYVRYCSVSKSTHSTHKLMATWLEAIYSLGVVSCHVTCLSHSGWWIICHPYSLDWGPLF